MPLASTDSAMIVTRSWSTERNPPSICAERHDAVGVDPHLALPEHAEDGGVTRQDAEVAVDGAGADLARLTLPDLAVRGDELDLERHQRFFWISAHWRSTSSRPPHMKNACSPTWS